MAKTVRVGLSLWDRVVLLFAWSITSALVYLLGFYVGKGTQDRPLGAEERVVSVPVTSRPPAEGQRPKAEAPFDFYGRLGEPGRNPDGTGAPAHLVEPPAPTPAPTLTVPAPSVRPGATGPTPAPAVKPTAAPAAPGQPAPDVRPAGSVPQAAHPVAVRPAQEGTPSDRDGPGVPRAPQDVAGIPPPPPAHTAAGEASPQTGRWTVEVNPTRSHEEVEALQAQLRRRGYESVVVTVPREGDTWYRLRVGRYATSEQASQVMRRLRAQEGVTHAFVASE